MLVTRIHEIAESSPTRTAIIRNDVEFSYLAFSNLIQFMTCFLEQKKLPAGGTAVIPAMDPLVEWVLVLAMRSLGLNTIVINSFDQVDTLALRDCACVVTPEIHQVSSEDITKFSSEVQFVTIFNRYFQNAPSLLLPIQPCPHPFGGHILYTSGTTGAYKKVLYEGRHEAQRNHEQTRHYSITEETVLHNCNMALWTAAGFRMPPAVWSNGGCVLLERREDMYKHFFSHGANFAVVTPRMLRDLLQSCDYTTYPSSKCTIVVGGGFLSLELAGKAVRKLTHDLHITYASTEIIGPILRSNYKSVSDLFWFKPVFEERVQIVDKNGVECATGQEGELRIRLNDVDCRSYIDDEVSTEKVFCDGYFYPGDMAVNREDGCIKILGRTSDVVNIQGSKFAAAPIEQSIQSLLAVNEVCIFSGLDDIGHEALVIAIETEKELAKSDLQAVGSRFKQFEKVSIVVMRHFPRTEYGLQKIDRGALKNHIFKNLAQLATKQ